MRTTVDLDSHLLSRLRAEARRRGVPFKEILTTILRRGLEAAPERTRYRCPTFSLGLPSGRVSLDKALALAGALEDEETDRKLRLRK
jgi:hypothetical protein